MPNSVNNVKTEYTFETKKAQSAISKLIGGLKRLEGSVKNVPQKISLEEGIKNAYSEIKTAKSAISDLTLKIKDQQNAIKGYEQRIKGMTSSLEKTSSFLQNTLGKWHEVGNAIGRIKDEQRATSQAVTDYQKQIDVSRGKIEATAKTLERLKALYGQFEEARANRDKAVAERDSYREWRVSQMSVSSPWYAMTPEQREDTLARDETMRGLNKAAKEAYATMSDLKGQIEEVTGMVGKVDTTFQAKTEQLNEALREENRNLKEAEIGLKSSESALGKMSNQQANLEQRARALSASFREVAGAEASMKQSSIDAYVNKEQAAIDQENNSLQQNKQTLEEEKNARDMLRMVIEGNSATIEQNKEAIRREAEEQKKAAQAKKDFQRRLRNVSKAIKDFKNRISSTLSGLKSFASSIKGAIPGANKFGGALGKLASQFKRLFVMRILRNAISAMIKGFQEGIQNVAQYSAALNNLDANHANQTMSELASTALYLKNTLGSAAIPALNAILPIIRAIATGFATAVNYVNQFISALSGKSSWTRAKQVTVDYASSLGDVGSSAGGAKDAVEDLKRTILGFDEINKLNDANSSSGSGGSGSGGGGSDSVNASEMFEEVPIDNKVTKWLGDLKPYIDNIKDAWDKVKTAVKNLVESEGFKYLISTTFKMVLSGIAQILSSFGDSVTAFKNALNNPLIKQKIDDIKDAWDGVLGSIKDLTESDAWKAVIEAVTFAGLTLLESILTSISGLVDAINGGLTDLVNNGKVDALKGSWEDVTNAISDLVKSDGFKKVVGTVIDLGVTGLSGVFTTITNVINNSLIPALDDLKENGTFDDIKKSWESIWESIKNISNSEVFRVLMDFTLKAAIEGISSVLKGMKGILELIDGIFSADVSKMDSGLRGIVEGFLNLFQPIWEKVDEALGTDLAKQNKTLMYAIEHGLSYDQAEQFLNPDGSVITNGLGKIWAKQFTDGSWIVFPDRDDITAKFAEWKQNVWDKIPGSERALEFKGFLANNAEEMAKLFRLQPWNDLSATDKQLAFDAYIASLPADLAREFMYSHGTAPSWANLTEEEKALAWVAYISTNPEKLSDDYLKKWGNPTVPTVDVGVEAKTEPKKVVQKYKNTYWDKLTADEKKLNFGAAATTSASTVAQKYKNTYWDKLTADEKKLDFGAKLQESSKSSMWSDLKDYMTKWAVPVNGDINNPSTMWYALRDYMTTYDVPIDGEVNNPSSMWYELKDYMTKWDVPIDGDINNASDMWYALEDYMTKWDVPIDGDINNPADMWYVLRDYMTKWDIPIDGDINNPADIWYALRDYMIKWDVPIDGDINNPADIWKSLKTYMTTYDVPIDGEMNNLGSMYKDFQNYFDGISFSATAKVSATIVEGYSDTVLTFKEGRLGKLYTGGIVGKSMGGLIQAASGRFISSAQMFMARENGIPEYVGRFGSHSAVANNYQIVTGIASGVEQANAVQNELLREQNALLREIAMKSGNTSVSSILGAMERVNRRTGQPVVTMG